MSTLSGNIVVIIGGSSGIGLETAGRDANAAVELAPGRRTTSTAASSSSPDFSYFLTKGMVMPPTRSPERPLVAVPADEPGLRVEIYPGIPVVAEIRGEIDVASAPWLREKLLLAIRRHGAVLCVDLQGVTFLDCSGISVLLATARRAKLEGGRMRVVRPSSRVRRVIGLLRLQDALTSVDAQS